MSRPDLFPAGEPAFDMAKDRRDFVRAVVILVVVLLALALGTGAALWWLDRVASAPMRQPAAHASWIPAPLHQERDLAKLEVEP